MMNLNPCCPPAEASAIAGLCAMWATPSRRTKCNHNDNQQAHYNKASHAEIGYPPSRRGGERVTLASWYDPLGGGRKEGPFSTWRVETPHSAQLELALRAQASSPLPFAKKPSLTLGPSRVAKPAEKKEKPASLKENCLKLRGGGGGPDQGPFLEGRTAVATTLSG